MITEFKQGDTVDTFAEREKMFRHRDKIYEAEMARLGGEPTFTPGQIPAELEVLYAAAEK